MEAADACAASRHRSGGSLRATADDRGQRGDERSPAAAVLSSEVSSALSSVRSDSSTKIASGGNVPARRRRRTRSIFAQRRRRRYRRQRARADAPAPTRRPMAGAASTSCWRRRDPATRLLKRSAHVHALADREAHEPLREGLLLRLLRRRRRELHEDDNRFAVNADWRIRPLDLAVPYE